MTDPALKKWLLNNGKNGEKLTEQEIDDMRKEEKYYPPTKIFLQNYLEEYGCSDVYLEITGFNSWSQKLKTVFGSAISDQHTFFSPDIAGTYKKNDEEKVVIVEIKPDELKMRDIYQTLGYFDIGKADFGILLSPKKIPIRIEKYLNENKDLLTMCNRNIFVGRISMDDEQLDPGHWYPDSPDF